MFYIYSLELETLKLQLHGYTESKDSAEKILKNTSVEFVRSECGDKMAENAFNEISISQDGYFLKENNDKIDVFLRKTIITPGTIWGASVKYQTTKVKFYSIVEYLTNTDVNVNTVVEKPSVSVSKTPEKVNLHHENLMLELKEKLTAIRLANTENEYTEVQKKFVSFLEDPIESSDDDIAENYVVKISSLDSESESEELDCRPSKLSKLTLPVIPKLPLDNLPRYKRFSEQGSVKRRLNFSKLRDTTMSQNVTRITKFIDHSLSDGYSESDSDSYSESETESTETETDTESEESIETETENFHVV